VPAAEIVEAVRAVLEGAFAMPVDALVIAVARELGYQRTGGRIKLAIGSVAEQMLQQGMLVEAGGHLRLAPPA
jgi:hypothetical protein